MIIAADATTFARKLEDKLTEECDKHVLALSLGMAGIDDFAGYRFEVGYITALRLCREMMVEAGKELSEPPQNRTATA